jgi:hypothetical protein
MRAKVHKHRLAQRQARQVKGKRENRYVIKVMNEHREGGQGDRSFGPRGPKVVRSLLIGL